MSRVRIDEGEEKRSWITPIEVVLAILIVGVLMSVPIRIIGGAYFEAQAYERVTGKHVSTWDAIFLDLRVEESTRGAGSTGELR